MFSIISTCLCASGSLGTEFIKEEAIMLNVGRFSGSFVQQFAINSYFLSGQPLCISLGYFQLNTFWF